MAAGPNGATPSENPWAGNYYAAQIQIVPGRAGVKRPLSAWADKQAALMSREEFEALFGPAGEFREALDIGILTGPCSPCGHAAVETEGLFLLDCDEGEGKHGIARWNAFVETYLNGIEPETWMARSGGGGLHIYFLAPPGWKPPTIKLGDWDIRGVGGYAVAPPSLHASGKRYEWLEGRAPWEGSISFAPDELTEEIDHCRAAMPSSVVNGQRVDVPGQFDAFGAQTDGRETRMRDTIFAVLVDCRRDLGDQPDPLNHPHVVAERERAFGLYLSRVKTNIQGVSEAEGLERENRGRSYFDQHWAYTARQWDGKLKGAAGQPKPAPRPKDDAPPGAFFDPWGCTPVAEFPLDRVPRTLQAFVETKAAALGVRQTGLAMASLTAISGAIDHRTKLRMQPGYFLGPNLWALAIADPGQKKSPILTAAVAPLAMIEGKLARERLRDVARWRELNKGNKTPDDPEPPPAPRFIVNDATTEAIAKILSWQNRGVLIVADEFGGLIGRLDSYNTNALAARSFLCQARQGGPFAVDRKAEAATHLDNLSVSVLSAAQPEKLGNLGNLTDDGLLQRVLPVLLEDGPPFQPAEDEAAVMRYSDLIEFLSGLKSGTVVMSAQAFNLSVKVRHDLEEYASQFREYNPHLRMWVSKLGDVLGNIALNLHLMEHRCKDYDVIELELKTMENAAALLKDFIIPHGVTFYEELAIGGSRDVLRRVASFILTDEQLRTRYTYSDLKYNVRTPQIDTVQKLVNLIAPLVAGKWMSVVEGSGQYDIRWDLRQGLREAFADRIDSENERKEAYRRRFRGE